MEELTAEERAEIMALIAKKREAVAWVLENRNPKDPERLRARVVVQDSILAKLRE